MHCSNCGSDIPFAGNVCPHCHADKSGDQATMALAVIGGGIGGWLGYSIGDFGGALVGFFCGAIPLIIVGVAMKAANENKTGGVPTLPNLAATLRRGSDLSTTTTDTTPLTRVRDEVPCHHCAEPILRQAKKCKHCGGTQPLRCPKCSGELLLSPDGKRAKCEPCGKLFNERSVQDLARSSTLHHSDSAS